MKSGELLPIVCAMRVCERNASAFADALRASAHLDGQLPACLFLGIDRDFHGQLDEFRALAEKAFAHVGVQSFDAPPQGAWPVVQNAVWQQTARWLNEAVINAAYSHFLWWESDACPIRKGWLHTLASAITLQPTAHCFLGVPCIAPDGTTYMNGVGLWPLKSLDLLADAAPAAFYCRETPFDIAARYGVMRHFVDIGGHIIHQRKAYGGSQPPAHARAQLDTLLKEKPAAVFLHGCQPSVILAHLTGKPLKPSTAIAQGRNAFYHSGDLGDIIYSLLTARELGGGDIYLGPDNRTGMMTRERMTLSRAQALLPLLEAQPYIVNASYIEQMPEHITRDLNQMRVLLRQERLDMKPGFNLARCYLQAFGLALDNDQNAWLHTPAKRAIAPVIIARSPRYHNDAFRWDRLLSHYRGHIAFVGSRDEHAAFCAQWGQVPYHPTSNLLDLAEVIAGCELFVGNQSCPYAIAEGLKKPAILEACPTGSNTLFQRADVIVGITDATTFPRLSVKPVTRLKLAKHITIKGPVDWFTGLGRLTCQLAMEAKKAGFDVALERMSWDERLALPSGIAGLKGKAKAGAPRVVVTPLLAAPKNLSTGDIAFTMWESTRLPRAGVEALNAKASLVIVPSRWCAAVFSANGVTAPLAIVPLGVDRSVFYPVGGKMPGRNVFGAAGRLAHGGKRKGIEDVIAAFGKAFPMGKEKASLKLKLFDDSPIPPFKDKRISVDTRLLFDEQMREWYLSLSCFVSAAKGEGWGLHVHEAIACGIPVLAPAHSGLADLVSPLVPYTLVEASEGYEGHWHQVSVEALANQMRESSFSVPLNGAFIEPAQTFAELRGLLCA